MMQERVGDVQVRMPLFDRFAGLRKDIQSITKFAVAQTAKHIPLHETTIRILDNPQRVIPEHAHSGWTHSAEKVRITLNPKFPDKEKLLYEELPRSVSHELHHAVRTKALPDEPETLGAALISEGLAVQFETEVWGGKPSAWATALTEEQIFALLDIVVAEIGNEKYNHARWFFGTENLPRWGGYAIGMYLVREYLRLHPGETAASLVSTPSTVILDGLKDTIRGHKP